MKRLIAAVTGASGSLLGYRLLQALRQEHPEVELHLVLSAGARTAIAAETKLDPEDFRALADFCYEEHDLAARISSGSFVTDGMLIVPCSMKTLSAVANGYSDNLVSRAADVCLKEGRKLVLVPRETPLSKAHLRNLLRAAEDGCVIVPPMLTFYNGASSLEEQMDHIIGKVLMQFGLNYSRFRPWEGVR